ncbi:MAG: thiamine pyrophosphate-binding protein [Draconibacterium sp.]
MSTVAQQFAHTLRDIGVRYVFGVPSGNMIDYIEAIREEEGIDFVLVGHEATAAIMADVCGRITGVQGVCFATFGPGATNLSTGVGEALLDRSPLLAFTDEMPDQIRKIERLWTNSEKPVFAVGMAAVRAGVKDLIVQLAEKNNISVVLTPMAKGIFPEDHPLYTGVLFHALSDMVAETYGEADLVVGIGYDPVEFNYEDWMPAVPLIHIDEEEADVDAGKLREVLNVSGNIEMALRELLKLNSSPKKWDLDKLAERKNRMFQKLLPPPGIFGPRAILHELREALPPEGILTVDVGAHLHLLGQQWRTPSPEKLLMTNGWQRFGIKTE